MAGDRESTTRPPDNAPPADGPLVPHTRQADDGTPLLSIAGRFALFLVLLSLLPLLLLGGVSFTVAEHTIDRIVRDYAMSVATARRSHLESEVAQIEALIAEIASLDQLVDALQSGDASRSDYDRLAAQAVIGEVLNRYLNLHDILSVDVIGAGDAYFHVGSTLETVAPSAEQRSAIFTNVEHSGDSVVWLGVEPSLNATANAPIVATAAKAIRRLDRDRRRLETVGVVLVNRRASFFPDLEDTATKGTTSYLVVADRFARIASHPDFRRVGGSAGAFVDGTRPGDVVEESIDGTASLVAATAATTGGWRAFLVTPMDAIRTHTNLIAITTATALTFCLGLILFGSALFSRDVVAPIRRITEQLKRLNTGNGDSAERIAVAGRGDVAELGHWFNTFLDTLDQHRRAEASRLEIRERYELALRATSDVIWDWDLTAARVTIAPHYAKMIGIEAGSVGDSPEELFARVHPDDAHSLRRRLDAHLASQEREFEAEFRLLRENGEPFWVHARAYTLRRDDGTPYRLVGAFDDITGRKEAEERLLYDATHDALTGLPNRLALTQTMDAALAAGHGGIGLALIDVDNFKGVNDTLGHNYGDALLVAIAQILRTHAGGRDVAGRLGGDEFAILRIAGTDDASMEAIAAGVRATLADPLDVADTRIAATLSIGTAIAEPGDLTEDLLRKADLALYAAKHNGRDCACSFDRAMELEARERFQIETQLRSEEPEACVRLVFQPQIDAARRDRVSRYEVLSRWVCADGSTIRPDKFIATAERIGAIHAVTRIVMTGALEALKAFDAIGRRDVMLAVNLSPIDLARSGFAEETIEMFRRTEVDPRRIEFEITEGSLLSSTPAVVDNMRQLTALGCRFALDDFGTGYSSLAYLRRFPIHTIKIDRAFLDEPDDEAAYNGSDIVAAIVGLGHSMGKLVIAEGVETAEMAERLVDDGCDLMQGFFFHRPMGLDAALRLAAGGRELVAEVRLGP